MHPSRSHPSSCVFGAGRASSSTLSSEPSHGSIHIYTTKNSALKEQMPSVQCTVPGGLVPSWVIKCGFLVSSILRNPHHGILRALWSLSSDAMSQQDPYTHGCPQRVAWAR